MAILTISRQLESGGRMLGHAVEKEMNYAYVDRQTILDDMRKAGEHWEEQAKEYDENYPTVWQRYKWNFRGFVMLNQYHFLEHALADNVVIMGRGGNFLLKGIPHALRVRTTAPLEQRVDRLMERLGTNREHAQWLVEKADSEMAGAVYLIYGRRWDDPAEYDMVFDTSLVTLEEMLARVKSTLLERDTLKSEKAVATLRLRTIAAKVKAGIATDPSLMISVLDVRPKEEGLPEYGLVVRGVVHNRDDINRIKEAAKSLAGDLPVDFELQYRWYGRMGPHEFK